MSIASPDPALLHDVLDGCARRVGVLGAQLTVATAGGRVELAWGETTPGRPMTTSTRSQVGSVAKVLTAVLVHQLVDDGLLGLDDPVDAVDHGLPEGVLVGQLLSMTSGLDAGVWAAGSSVADALRPQLALPRRDAPGSFGYSMAATMVAARIVEVLRGTSWWDAVLQRIARPIGLGLCDVADGPGYAPGRTGWAPIAAPPFVGMGPTGTTLCASAGELAAVAVALADADGALLSASSQEALHRPVVGVGTRMCADAWCHGPYLRRCGELVLHGHGGRWAGGVSDLTWHADSATAVSVVTNTPSRGAALVREISREVHPLLWGDAAFVEPSVVSGVDLDALTGDYATASRRYEVRRDGDRLVVRARSRSHPAASFELPDSDTELAPVGGRRFLPAHETNEERRLQEFWFAAGQRPDHCYDGFVAARRVDASS